MKNVFYLVLFVCVFASVCGIAYAQIPPPEKQYAHISTSNSTISAPNYNGTAKFSNANCIVVTAGTQTVYVNVNTTNHSTCIITANPDIAILTAGGATIDTNAGANRTKIFGIHFPYYVLTYNSGSPIHNATWNAEVPPNIDTNYNVIVDVRWIQTSSGSGSGVCFAGQFLSVGTGGTWDSPFGTSEESCNTSLNSVGVINDNSFSFTSTQHGLIAGQPFVFKLYRDTSNSSDNLSVSAQVLDVRITWG